MNMRHFLIVLLLLCAATYAAAQERLPVREYTPPEELISIDAEATFTQAVEIFNAASKRFRSKPIIYDGDSKDKIGINIVNMHWFDAFELVLKALAHWYIDSEDFTRVYALSKQAAKSEEKMVKAAEALQTREVQISAVFFEANRSELERLGLDWFLTNSTPSTSVGILNSVTGTTSFKEADDGGGEGETEIETGNITTLAIGNGTVELLAALKAFQSENLGELISSPNITVRSGEKGRIQVGQDISIKQKDFAGNTTEKFFSTGTIIEVTPTVIVQDSIEFVNLEISAERSTALPDVVSTIINKTLATTSVVLIDGEETVVGGLVSNEAKNIRRGVPFLKDLPWWVFGLRYLFGYEETTIDKKELIIVLKANIVPTLQKRIATRMNEIRNGQQSLLNEANRLEALRQNLLNQIELARQNR
ncbi:MAG: type II and III secretion system protein [Bacteroidia bacterium]|nr:type II and III secretion system protein [Bacteroidia bacterium]